MVLRILSTCRNGFLARQEKRSGDFTRSTARSLTFQYEEEGVASIDKLRTLSLSKCRVNLEQAPAFLAGESRGSHKRIDK